ncbi:hypothetical protein Tco_1137360 [Tanacetum coccineum]
MGRDTIQLEDDVSTISGEYILEFTSEYGIPEGLHPELPGPEETIMDFPEDSSVTIVSDSAAKDGMPPADSYSSVDVTTLNTCRTPIQKQPEVLLCLVGLSGNYFLEDDVYPTFLCDDDREMDLFNLISALNPLKVKTEIRPRTAHEVPLLTVTASRVIEIKETGVASESSGTPSALEKSPLDFADEDPPQTIAERVGTEGQVQDELSREIPSVGHATTAKVVPKTCLEEEVATVGPPVNKRRKQMRCKGVNDEAETNAPPNVLRKDHVSSRGTATEIPTEHVATTEVNVQLSVGSPELGRSTSVPFVVGSPGGIYQPGWGVTNDCRLDTPATCQDKVDHIVPPGYFSKLRHLSNADFLSQYNMNLTRQVAMGSQLRLRFEQEARLLKKARAKIARRDKRIQIKNLETLLEAEADMKKVAEAKNAELTKELESLRVRFSDLQVNNNQLSQQVSNLQAQITGEEEIKAAFEQFKKYEDDRVEQHCAEMDARLDKLSCAESTELRQVFANVVSAGIAKGMSEGLKYDVEHGKAGRDLMDGDTGEDAPQRIRDLRPSSSQLKIPVYPEVRNPKDPWAVKEEMMLEDAIGGKEKEVQGGLPHPWDWFRSPRQI